MKKILMILAILLLLGAVATSFISKNLNASGPTQDTSTEKPPTDPHEHYGTKTLCYNTSAKPCGSR